MKNVTSTEGTAKVAQYSTANTTSNISYIVAMTIRQVDQNRKCKVIVDKKTTFKGASALDCRKKAISYAVQLGFDARIDGKLCKYHLDSPTEAMRKGMKNFTALSTEVICRNSITEEELIIHEGDLNHPAKEFLDDCQLELLWYKRYGYDTDGKVIKVRRGLISSCQILDYQMLDEEYVANFFAKVS